MKRSLVLIVSFILLLSAAAVACSQRPPLPEQRAPAGGQTEPASSAKAAWEQEWERTLAAARKEGSVTFNSGSGYTAEWRRAFSEAFSQKYSITVDFVVGPTGDTIARLVKEQQNKVYNADVTMMSSGYVRVLEDLLQPFEPALILPEVTDRRNWWRGEYTWLDPDRKTMFAFREAVVPTWVINTDLVKPGELKSWNDLLEPKWKGRLLLNDPTLSGAGQQNMTILAYRIKDWDYIRALLRQEPDVQRDNNLMMQWVARAKYPFVISPRNAVVYEFMQAGAPLAYVTPAEGTYTSVGDGIIGLLQHSPHPNAARVFINFFLSKEGQTIFARNNGYQSLRVDVPTDFLEQATVRQPGGKYFSTLDRDYLENDLRLREEVVKLFQAYLKK
ncbi:MAG: extracellular solute-binding protein [Chloroflexi bacterium]|nr:extracellular solute-binding protein [Chloroflexota bacterium]